MPSTQKALEQLGQIVQAFSTKEFPDIVTKSYIQNIGKPIEGWSLGNQLLVILGGSGDARTYNQWIKAGRHVKKGTKAIYILAPCLVTKKVTNKTTQQEEEQKIPVGFRAVPVFKYEDTDGAPLKETEPRKLPPLSEVATQWGVQIRYAKSRHGEYGAFDLVSNEIILCTEDVVTFFHELTHKAHSLIEKLKPGQDPEQEAIAQLTACVLGRLYGVDAMNYSWNYIASYAQEHSVDAVGKLCFRILSKVQKILKMILEEAESIDSEKELTLQVKES